MAVVVNLCDSVDDLARELCDKTALRLGDRAEAFLSSSSALISKSDVNRLVDLLLPLLTSSELLCPVSDAALMNPETAFSLLVVVAKSSTDFSSLVPKLSIALTSCKENSSMRARCLASLYHSAPAQDRIEVFKICLVYAGDKTPVTENVSADSVAVLLAQCGATKPQSRELFLALSDAFQGQPRGQRALVFYLLSFDSGDEAAVDMKRVTECALNAVRDPVSHSDVASCAAMRRLEAENAHLFQLVNITSGDSLDAYLKFTKEHAGFEAQVGLDPERTLEMMRLLALASLGGEGGVLTYQDVAMALHVDSSEVERWVIRAIGKRVVEARMDQVNSTVSVVRCATVKRTAPSGEEWKRIAATLNKWRDSVKAVKNTVNAGLLQPLAVEE